MYIHVYAVPAKSMELQCVESPSTCTNHSVLMPHTILLENEFFALHIYVPVRPLSQTFAVHMLRFLLPIIRHQFLSKWGVVNRKKMSGQRLSEVDLQLLNTWELSSLAVSSFTCSILQVYTCI